MDKLLSIFHVSDISVMSPAAAVEVGLFAWVLLAVSMASIFVVVLIVNAILKKKGNK